MNFISTGEIYEDFHLQTGDIMYLSTGDVAGLQHSSMLHFVARVGLVGCALEFLGRIGLGLVFGCMSPVDMVFKYVCTCVCVCVCVCERVLYLVSSHSDSGHINSPPLVGSLVRSVHCEQMKNSITSNRQQLSNDDYDGR